MPKKALLAALLVLAMLAGTSAASPQSLPQASAKSDIRIEVHGKKLTLPTPPIVVKNTTLVPLRQIAEALGAEVKAGKDKQQRQTATLTRGDKSALITVGLATMTAKGRTVKLDAAPVLQGNYMMVPLRALSEALGAVVKWDGINRIARIENPPELPTVGTADNLRKLASQIRQSISFLARDDVATAAEAGSGEGPAPVPPSAPSEAPSPAGEVDHSTTNVQVEGVDEADWAKTDGRFIYQITAGRVLITDIRDASAPKLAANIEYSTEDGFRPQEMYVENGRLVVIGQHELPMQAQPVEPSGEDAAVRARIAADALVMPYPYRSMVKTYVYELSDDGQPKLVREAEIEGGYVSSRKIGSALYIVANKYNNLWRWIEPPKEPSSAEDESAMASDIQPVYADSAAKKGLQQTSLPLDDIRYFPGSPESGTMTVASMDLDRPDQEMQVSAYMGAGQTIYASAKNLYVAISKYVPQDAKGESYREETQVHKFRLDQGSVVYLGQGSVPGSVLNQFSMDEHLGFFRLATTRNQQWNGGETTASSNNLYVLDESLQTIGTLENLAPGERIYSVRFMGKRAYMVTFRTVDPLFAIDLSDPTKPDVLGQLKIPGFSDYLHPYDENHLIGFGKETVEGSNGGSGVPVAFVQGLKIGLFDVTDPANPKEKFKEVIGDRGTHSELLYNHKALLFSKEKGLMAFPVDLMEIKGKSEGSGGSPEYGQFTFQGAYVYGIDLEKGFTLRGRISHLSDEDLAKSGQYGYDYNKAVRRILYSGNTLYTLSESMVKGNDLNSLAERGTMSYPASAQPVNRAYPATGGPAMPVPMPEPAPAQ